ncbi:hypothetical protein NL676_002194 [Syzygium grande]|nr:hypothetical protein NL676_002194 [Syzygium grande]
MLPKPNGLIHWACPATIKASFFRCQDLAIGFGLSSSGSLRKLLGDGGATGGGTVARLSLDQVFLLLLLDIQANLLFLR